MLSFAELHLYVDRAVVAVAATLADKRPVFNVFSIIIGWKALIWFFYFFMVSSLRARIVTGVDRRASVRGGTASNGKFVE